ncbi:MAG: hypothetical protein Q8L48_16645 [Archangium sp.]|nr:hypothetical protein [Archangium sp.]
MGNKSKVKKDATGRNVARIVEFKKTDGKRGEKKVKWDEKRNLAEAGMPRSSRSWQGLKEKTIAPRVSGHVGDSIKTVQGRLVMKPLYNSANGVPKRKSPAPRPEVNTKRQPWQKKTAAP